MDGMKERFASPIYNMVEISADKVVEAHDSAFSARQDHLMQNATVVKPAYYTTIQNIAADLFADTKSDSTGTYTELKKAVSDFLANFDSFDKEEEIKNLVRLHSRASDYYNLHSSKRRTKSGQRRVDIVTGIIDAIQNEILAMPEGEKTYTLRQLSFVSAPPMISENEKPYKTKVGFKSLSLKKLFTRIAREEYLRENHMQVNDQNIEELAQTQPQIDEFTGVSLLNRMESRMNYDNLVSLLPANTDMDTYLEHCLYTNERRRIVQVICPDVYLDRNGRPIGRQDQINLEEAADNMQRLASGRAEEMYPIVDKFIQSIIDFKLPDYKLTDSKKKPIDEYVYENSKYLYEGTYYCTAYQNLIENVPEIKDYVRNNYPADFLTSLTKKMIAAINLVDCLKAVGIDHGDQAQGVGPILLKESLASIKQVYNLKDTTERYKMVLKANGGLESLNANNNVLALKPQVELDQIDLVNYKMAYHPLINEALSAFNTKDKYATSLKSETEKLYKHFYAFKKKKPILDGKYPVPSLTECQRIIKSGELSEKLALYLSLSNAVKISPAYFKDNPLQDASTNEEFGPGFAKLKEMQDKLKIDLFGKPVGRRRPGEGVDLNNMKPTKDECVAIAKMVASFVTVSYMDVNRFLEKELATMGKTITELTDEEKGKLYLKMVVSGYDIVDSVALFSISDFLPPLSDINFALMNQLISHPAYASTLEMYNHIQENKLSFGLEHVNPDEARAILSPYIGEMRNKYRKAGLYEKVATNEMLGMIEEGVGLVDFTDKHNEKKEETFGKLVLIPLEKAISKGVLDDNGNYPADYNQSVDELKDSLDRYVATHNPYSKIGKKRLDYVKRLLNVVTSEYNRLHPEADHES